MFAEPSVYTYWREKYFVVCQYVFSEISVFMLHVNTHWTEYFSVPLVSKSVKISFVVPHMKTYKSEKNVLDRFVDIPLLRCHIL